MTHSLGREQLSDFWYNKTKKEFSLGSATTAICKIGVVDHDGEILPSDSYSYYLPNKLYYARSSPQVQDVSGRFGTDGVNSFDLSSSQILRAAITQPIGHVKIRVEESNCLYLLAFLSSEVELNLEYVSFTQDIRLARSSTKIFENPNQSLFRANLVFYTDKFESIHQPTSVHKNLHILCIGFSESASKLKVDIDFKIKVDEPVTDNTGGEESGSNENTSQEEQPNSTGETQETPNTNIPTTEETTNSGGSGTENNSEPAQADPTTTTNSPEEKPEITKEQIAPKSSEDLENLDQTQEAEFIQNVISYFEEKEKDNVIVIEQSESSKDKEPDKGTDSSIVDSPDGKTKEIVTVQTVKTAICKIFLKTTISIKIKPKSLSIYSNEILYQIQLQINPYNFIKIS